MNATHPERSKKAKAPRNQVHVDLFALGEPLRREATSRQLCIADALREAVAQWLQRDSRPEAVPTAEALDGADGGSSKTVRRCLFLRPAVAELLLQRARARGTSQSGYVRSLVIGAAADPLPTDHAPMIAALRASTDDVAALSTDLNALMRMLGHASAAEQEPHRVTLHTLVQRVDAHLEQAAALFAELDRTRRWR